MTYWKDKRAVVVGGSAGLGRAVAKTLLQRGARVVVVGAVSSCLMPRLKN